MADVHLFWWRHLCELSLPPQHACIGPQKYGVEVGEGLEEVWGGAGRGVGRGWKRCGEGRAEIGCGDRVLSCLVILNYLTVDHYVHRITN